MSRRHTTVLARLLAVTVGACGGGGDAQVDATDADPDPDRTAALALLGAACDDAPDDVYLARQPPSPWTAADRGTVAACAFDRKLTVGEMEAHFTSEGIPPATVTTAVFKLRVAYWTENAAGMPVLTSAAFYLPEVRRGSPSPLVVAGHGSVGVADICAPSREHPDGFARDYRTQMYALVGDGWVVMAPDYPGIGTPGVGTWQLSADEGHAMLDGTRAARRLARSGLLSSKNAIVGHSNGGHAALSAQSYAATYGSDGTIEATVVWAPLWISNAAWGALISGPGASFLSPPFMAMTLMYLDGHLEAYDGASGTAAAYRPGKAAEVRALLEDRCWRPLVDPATGAASIGIQVGSDAFTDAFVTEIGDCGLGNVCDTPLAMTWRTRFAADRPVPDPAIPIVLWQGESDDFLTPGFQKCGVDRLMAQGADLTACQGPGDHSSVMSQNATWWRAYLENALLDGAAPAPCQPFAATNCTAPLPNGTAPGDP